MKIVFVIIISLFSITSVHEYYIGLTEITHNKDNKTLEISIKLFTDDLNKAISEANDTLINLNTEEELDISNQLIDNYLQEHFDIKVNKKDISLVFLGKEYEDDVCWLFIEAKKIRRIKNIEVRNELLFDVYKSQKHLTNLIIYNKTTSTTLDYKNPSFKKVIKK